MHFGIATAALIALAGAAGPAAFAAQTEESAPASDALRIATDYVEAYSALDTERMAALAGPEIRFADSTAPSGAIEHLGREAVIASVGRLRDVRGAISLGYVPESAYESNGWAVFSGPMNATFRTPDPDATYHWSAQVTIVIHVEDGQVVEHLDFADYANAEERIERTGEPPS